MRRVWVIEGRSELKDCQVLIPEPRLGHHLCSGHRAAMKEVRIVSPRPPLQRRERKQLLVVQTNGKKADALGHHGHLLRPPLKRGGLLCPSHFRNRLHVSRPSGALLLQACSYAGRRDPACSPQQNTGQWPPDAADGMEEVPDNVAKERALHNVVLEETTDEEVHEASVDY